jgi:DNA polymerase elongation subunit (family B)
MEKTHFFTYSWHVDDEDENSSMMIRIYGINEKDETIVALVSDFTPFVYLELPENLPWTTSRAQLVSNRLDEILGDKKPITKTLVFKKRLYYAHVHANKERKTFPYLCLSFANQKDIKNMTYKIRNRMSIPGVGNIVLKCHEQDASAVLQLTCCRDIPTAGWVEVMGKKVPKEEQITICDHEYKVRWKNISPYVSDKVGRPLIMGFDIEVNSVNPNVMPKAEVPGNKVFAISCVFQRFGETEMTKYSLSLGEAIQEKVGDDVKLLLYETESDLLLGFVKLLQTQRPHIITGYNIFTFDIPYMIERAKLNYCIFEYDQQGFLKNSHAKEKTIKWSSSAYGNQLFQFLDAEGILFVDLLPLVKRDYKMDNYKLKTISSFFLGETKDPLSVKGIFKCYRMGMQKNTNGEYTDKGRKAMSLVLKYCVQDSALVVNLFSKLQTWIGLCEMAKTCNVPIFVLYTQGQQIKVYSQIYKFCMYNNFVVEKDGYITKDDEHYQGAMVFEPIAGVYDRVVPFDFASLYPTTIIAYNIDYSTLVTDPKIKDEDCHVCEWTEHSGCIHDTTVRKTKPKHILCGDRKFRFLKEPKGVMPTVLQNLLDARANTRTQMKVLKKISSKTPINDTDRNLVDKLIPEVLKLVSKETGLLDEKYLPEIKKQLYSLSEVLEKRQLAYKISANSMYGSMGVSRGYLPFMPGAMSTTSQGRKNISIVAKTIPEKYGGVLVYGDTDSNYVSFPHLTKASEIWEHSEMVAKEISKLFPAPIKLEFEEVIYWRFFILTKKRYMSVKCDKNGVVSDKIASKGLLTTRRDNSEMIRNVYTNIIKKIFEGEQRDNVINYVLDEINKMCAYGFDYKNFVVTKSIKDIGNCEVTPFINEKKQKKGKMGDYTVALLSNDPKERERQFKLKDCTTEKDYYLHCLPAVVQLAQKMRKRGMLVQVGERIPYVITEEGGHTAKQYIKIEDADYYKAHSSVLKIDYMYYLSQMTNAFDDIFNVIYCNEKNNEYDKYDHKLKKDFILDQYNYRYKIRNKMLKELKNLFKAKLVFE